MVWFSWTRRLPWLLIAVGIFFVGIAGWLAQRSFDNSYRQGQAQTTARMVATTSIPRVMHAPGVEAWLRDVLEQAVHELPGEEKLAYSRIIDRGKAPDLPWFGLELAKLFAELDQLDKEETFISEPVKIEQNVKNSELKLRVAGKLLPDREIVVTRRQSLSYGSGRENSDAFIRYSSEILESLASKSSELGLSFDQVHKVESKFETVPWFLGIKLIRIYTVSEDGTYVSSPTDQDNPNRFDDEVMECHARSYSPTFVANDFIFDLDYDSEEGSLPRYSGIYLDIAGAGLVGTLVAPIIEPTTKSKGVLAADLAFNLDFAYLFAERNGATEYSIASNVVGFKEEKWQPWSALRRGLGSDASPELRDLVQYLAERETRHNPDVSRRPVYHHVMAETGETIFAMQLARTKWLIARVPGEVPATPWSKILAIPLLFLGLLVVLELRRRSARRAVSLVEFDLLRWHKSLRSRALPLSVEELGPHLDAQLETARQEERDRLAAILNHGVDTLARILSSELTCTTATNIGVEQVEGCRQFCGWLSEYMVRRIHVTQWTLENWGSGPKHIVLSSLEASQVEATAEVYSNICGLVRNRPELRARLHWNNGILSVPSKNSSGTYIKLNLDWPSDWLIGLPEEGVFGFVLGELLVNAIKYGAPGSVVEVTAQFNPTRKEVMLSVANELSRADDTGRPHGRRYGGLAIVRELATLCGWQDFEAKSEEGHFRVLWSCATVKRRRHDAVD